jgi:hypothetical protein
LFSAEDGSIELQTFRYNGSARTFELLYATLSIETASRAISYRTISADRFVVSGNVDGKRSYVLFRYAGDLIRGFSLSWHPVRQDDADIIAILQASYFVPLEVYRETVQTAEPILQPSPPTTETSDSSGLATTEAEEEIKFEHMGALSVVEGDETVVLLNGEIGTSTPLEFLRALKARPHARVLLLNSPGGLVDAGLLMAHEVRRRSLSTVVPEGSECLSACSFVFFAGTQREAKGSLGVHQVWSESNDLVSGQAKLSDVLEALDEFGVTQQVISAMLRTPPSEMHIFSQSELERFAINTTMELDVSSGSAGMSESAVVTTPSELVGPAPDSEEKLAAILQLELDNYQRAIDLAAGGEYLTAETIASNAVARISVLCRTADYPNIRACLGEDLPPLPQSPQLRVPAEAAVIPGSYYIHLATFRTRAEALTQLALRRDRIQHYLPGAELQVIPVQFDSSGLWYRLTVKSSTREYAFDGCRRLLAQSIDCILIGG